MTYNKGSGGSRFGGGSGGRPLFGGGRFGRSDSPRGGFGGGRSDGPVTLHKATCAQCGNTCEVPFRPTGERPVYCKDCFARMGGGMERDGDRRENRFEKRELRPNDAPKSYGEGSRGNVQGNDDVKKELQAMNMKLDRLIKVIEEVVLGKVEGRSGKEEKEEKEEDGGEKREVFVVKKAKKKGPKKT